MGLVLNPKKSRFKDTRAVLPPLLVVETFLIEWERNRKKEKAGL
jgi:hypothetical protein